MLETQKEEVNGSAAIRQSGQSRDRDSGGARPAESKKGGGDQENGEAAAATSKKANVQENVEAVTTASEKNVDQESGAPELGGEHGMDERTPASDQMDNVDQEIERPHLDDQERRETHAPASEKNGDQECEGRNGSELSAPSEPNTKKRKHDDGDEETAGAPASEGKSDWRSNVNQEIEGPHLDDQESGEMRAPASEKNGDQECDGHNTSELSAPSEPNIKKRKHDDGDEGTAGAEGHMGLGELGTSL